MWPRTPSGVAVLHSQYCDPLCVTASSASVAESLPSADGAVESSAVESAYSDDDFESIADEVDGGRRL